jgi:serine/threonine protein kinase
MNPERWRQVEELYHAALERDRSEHAALLAEADADVRREVEALLAQQTGDGRDDFTLTRATAGASLGPYRIEAKLGAGGMGEVYRALDSRLHRLVAIKVLAPDLSSDPAALERFTREARAASALNHPNICTLYDIGEDAGRRFLVMELLEGQSLRQRLDASPVPIPELVESAIQISDALDAAHRKGIIHRDL